MASNTSDDARQALDLAQTAYDAINEHINTLAENAFESPARFLTKVMEFQRQGKGPEYIIRVLNDDGIFGRRWHFGFMKGELFARGSRDDARKALGELPEAIRERKILGDKVRSLIVAYQNSLNREDQRRFALRPRDDDQQQVFHRGFWRTRK